MIFILTILKSKLHKSWQIWSILFRIERIIFLYEYFFLLELDPKVSQLLHFLYTVCKVFDVFFVQWCLFGLFPQSSQFTKNHREHFLEDSRCFESMLRFVTRDYKTPWHVASWTRDETYLNFEHRVSLKHCVGKFFRNISPEFLLNLQRF